MKQTIVAVLAALFAANASADTTWRAYLMVNSDVPEIEVCVKDILPTYYQNHHIELADAASYEESDLYVSVIVMRRKGELFSSTVIGLKPMLDRVQPAQTERVTLDDQDGVNSICAGLIRDLDDYGRYLLNYFNSRKES